MARLAARLLRRVLLLCSPDVVGRACFARPCTLRSFPSILRLIFLPAAAKIHKNSITSKKEIKIENCSLEMVIRRVGCTGTTCLVVYKYHLCSILFDFFHIYFSRFSSSLACRNVPSSHVAGSGFRRILLRSLSLSLSEASIQQRTDRFKFEIAKRVCR